MVPETSCKSVLYSWIPL